MRRVYLWRRRREEDMPEPLFLIHAENVSAPGFEPAIF